MRNSMQSIEVTDVTVRLSGLGIGQTTAIHLIAGNDIIVRQGLMRKRPSLHYADLLEQSQIIHGMSGPDGDLE